MDGALGPDPQGDGFRFDVRRPEPLGVEQTGGPGWRVIVAARIDGSVFETIKLDVIARPEEVSGGVEPLTVPPCWRDSVTTL